MDNTRTSSQMLHQWIYVIIPVSMGQSEHDQIFPLFSAYCKGCRTYFTESLPYGVYGANTRNSNVPKYGCTMPEDGIVM